MICWNKGYQSVLIMAISRMGRLCTPFHLDCWFVLPSYSFYQMFHEWIEIITLLRCFKQFWNIRAFIQSWWWLTTVIFGTASSSMSPGLYYSVLDDTLKGIWKSSFPASPWDMERKSPWAFWAGNVPPLLDFHLWHHGLPLGRSNLRASVLISFLITGLKI